MPGRDCVLECGPDKNCFTDTCCGNKKDACGIRQRTRNSDQEVNDTPADDLRAATEGPNATEVDETEA